MSQSNSIVQQLIGWSEARRPLLLDAGITLVEHFPGEGDECDWKAGIGLIKDEITVDFQVWVRTVFQADLTVVGGSGNALQIEYLTPSAPAEIEPVLDAVVARLRLGDYQALDTQG